MALELVKEVKETEAKAEAIRREASAQAKQILQDSHKVGEALLEEAKTQAKALRQEILQRADASIKEDEAKRRQEVEAQGEALAQAAVVQMDKAAEHIVERIVKG